MITVCGSPAIARVLSGDAARLRIAVVVGFNAFSGGERAPVLGRRSVAAQSRPPASPAATQPQRVSRPASNSTRCILRDISVLRVSRRPSVFGVE